MKQQHSERGQVLVLIILAIVAIFGFMAIAVDGGRVYAERRRAQTAADASAMAAAFAAIEKKDWSQAAMALVKENGYNDTQLDIEADEPMDVHIHHPPISGPYATVENKDEYYQVIIRNKVDQVFSQIVWQGKMEVTVEAVARAQPWRSIFPGNAMVATNEDACNAVDFSGSGSTTIDGGNIFSNSDEDVQPSGNDNCASGRQNGSGNITVKNGDILTVGDWVDKGSGGSVDPIPDANDNPAPLEMPNWPMPDCSKFLSSPLKTEANHILVDGVKTLSEGRYSGIKITTGDWKLEPGMYCIYNTGFNFNGGSLTGIGVTFMVLDGDVSVNGSGDITLYSPSDLKDPSDNQWGGMLFYMPWDNGGNVSLSGNSNATYTGTILAPGPSDSNTPKCSFGGTSGSVGGMKANIVLSSSIVCNTVQVTGNANVTVYYKPEANYHLRPSVDLSQ